MSINSWRRPASALAVWCVMLALAASVDAQENIDAFARAHLEAAQAAKAQGDAKAAASATDVAPPPSADTGRQRAEPFELIYIQGVDAVTVAYVRVDGRFGKTVKRGDRVRDWQVAAIGDDYLDLTRGALRRRLLLPSGTPSSPRGAGHDDAS